MTGFKYTRISKTGLSHSCLSTPRPFGSNPEECWAEIVGFLTHIFSHLPTPSTASNTEFQLGTCWLNESPLEWWDTRLHSRTLSSSWPHFRTSWNVVYTLMTLSKKQGHKIGLSYSCFTKFCATEHGPQWYQSASVVVVNMRRKISNLRNHFLISASNMQKAERKVSICISHISLGFAVVTNNP